MVYNFNNYMDITSKRPRKQAERSIQKAFFDWLSFSYPEIHKLGLVYHVPNGGSRNKIEAKNLQRAGVMAGIPDVVVAIPNQQYHGLYLEFKAPGNSVTKTQEKVIGGLKEQGYCVEVCDDWYKASQIFERYIKTSVY